MRKMKAMKFKSSELGPIPVDWEVKRIGEVGKLMRDSVNTQVFPDQTYYEYSMPNYDDGRIPRVVLGRSLFSNKTSIQGEVLLFNKLNVRKRRIWYVKEALPNAICSSEFLPYYSKEIDLCFLSYFLSTDKCTSAFEDYSTGTSNSQKRIAPLDFENFTIPLPPIAEQRRIARALSDVDELISVLGKLIEKKRNIKTGAMQQLLAGKTRLPGFDARRTEFKQTELGPIPVDWEVKRLGGIGESIRGVSFRPEQSSLTLMPSATMLLRANNIQDNQIICHDVLYVMNECIAGCQQLTEGDILICAANGSRNLVGKAAVWHKAEAATFGAFMAVFRCVKSVDSCFVGYLFQSQSYRRQLDDILTGSAINNLNAKDIEGLAFAFPTLAEQKAIAAVLSDMDAEIAALEVDRAKYERIKSGMMQELLTGKTRLKGE